MENFSCAIEARILKNGPCLYEKHETIEGNPSCPQCNYYRNYLIPPKPETSKSCDKSPPKKHKKKPLQKFDKKERPFSDSRSSGAYSSIDSSKLRYLIAVYREQLQKAQKTALKAFWNRAKRLYRGNLRLNTGLILDRMSQEEMALLKEAQNGSLEAIKKLIEATPQIMELPFVTDEMIHILHEYKISEGPLGSIRQDVWPGFLPNRAGGRLSISDESLRGRIVELIESPINDVLIDLNRRRILSEHGAKTTLKGIDLSKLITQIERKGYVTKELACQIIGSYLPVNQKKIRSIRIRERSGRPHKKIP